MKHAEQPEPENGYPGDRLFRLCEASLRINASLDVDTALRAVTDGARSLTGAPYSVITTMDDEGIETHLEEAEKHPGKVVR